MHFHMARTERKVTNLEMDLELDRLARLRLGKYANVKERPEINILSRAPSRIVVLASHRFKPQTNRKKASPWLS